MTEPIPNANPGTANANPDPGATEPPKTFTQADIDRAVTERLTRERAKFADYDDLKKRAAAAMTDTEKAVKEAEDRGRNSAKAETGTRLAAAEFKAAAAGRVDEATLTGFLEYADLTKFVKDGEPDQGAIAAAITKLGGSKPASFDGGARGPAAVAGGMNDLIRRAAGHA